MCVPSMTAGVVLRYTISRSRHCDRCADWPGFSLRGVALRRSLSMYITSLKKKEVHVHGTCTAYEMAGAKTIKRNVRFSEHKNDSRSPVSSIIERLKTQPAGN